MKQRIIAILLTLVLLLSAFSFEAVATEAPLTTADAILVLQHLIGLDVEPSVERHDRDDSGTITITDAVLLLRELNDPNFSTGNQLSMVSYNVRCKSDGTGRTISERSVRFKKVMDQYDPDIMGLQEVVPEWMEYLKRDFAAEYGYVNQWRAESDKEGTPIFWKKDKFELLDSGHFWLSDTPDQESKAESWGAEYFRICMWVKLKIKATGRTILFYNTHFDTAKEPRVPSANLIIERATEQGGFTRYPVFCTGDFNMRRSQDSYKAMCNKFKDVNAELENLKTPTSNGYHEEGKEGYLIDYCFYSPEKALPLKYQIIDEYVDNGYVSDHCGLYIEASLIT